MLPMKIESTIVNTSGPDILITASPEIPGVVASAQIVSIELNESRIDNYGL